MLAFSFPRAALAPCCGGGSGDDEWQCAQRVCASVKHKKENIPSLLCFSRSGSLRSQAWICLFPRDQCVCV